MQVVVGLEAGWNNIQAQGIDRIEAFIETGEIPKDVVQRPGKPLRLFGVDDYSYLYTTVYNMCVQRSPSSWAQQLYIRYVQALSRYCQQKVLPSLSGKSSKLLLQESLRRWSNHKIYLRWMEKFFAYLDRYYVDMHGLEPLRIKGLAVYKSSVYDIVKDNVVSAIQEFISEERSRGIAGTYRRNSFSWGDDAQEIVKGLVDMFLELKTSYAPVDVSCAPNDSSSQLLDQVNSSSSFGNSQMNDSISCSVYSSDLEPSILEATACFYREVYSKWIQTDSLSEFCRKADLAIEEEKVRIQKYLYEQSWLKQRQVLVSTLLQGAHKDLFGKEDGLDALLERGIIEEMTVLYKLFSLVEGGLVPVSNSFKKLIIRQGNSVIDQRLAIHNSATAGGASAPSASSGSNDPVLVLSMLELHGKFKSWVEICYRSDSLVHRSLKEGFETFLNRDSSSSLQGNNSSFNCAALLSSYCDRILKKGGENNLGTSEVESQLGKVIELFGYLSDKDLFAEIYRNQLSKRLLQESSVSEDLEKSFIQKLKMKCGAQFCSKLEGMLLDMRLALDMQKEFKSKQGEQCRKKAGFEFNALVLTTGFWPAYQPIECHLLEDFQLNIELFHSFYSAKTCHRKLTWLHALSTVTLSGWFEENKRYEIICSTCQALILLTFNSKSEIAIDELATLTAMDKTLLIKFLATMTLSKFKLLTKPTEEDRIITVNKNFQCPVRRFKLPPPSSAGIGGADIGGEGPGFSKERVEEDRSIAIQATIVRIMKARKTSSHQQLIAEVLSQLNFFKPNIKIVKQQIDHLIEREFLERDANQTNVYNYLA